MQLKSLQLHSVLCIDLLGDSAATYVLCEYTAIMRLISESTTFNARFRATGKRIVVQFTGPIAPNQFLNYLTSTFESLLRDAEAHDMIGLKIQNETSVVDKPIGLSFRRRDQLSPGVVLQLIEKVAQSNASFSAYDKLVIQVDIVHMPAGNGGVKAKGRSVSNLSHIKTSIVQVKSRSNCLAHALLIAVAKIENHPEYKSYIMGRKIEKKCYRPSYRHRDRFTKRRGPRGTAPV